MPVALPIMDWVAGTTPLVQRRTVSASGASSSHEPHRASRAGLLSLRSLEGRPDETGVRGEDLPDARAKDRHHRSILRLDSPPRQLQRSRITYRHREYGA